MERLHEIIDRLNDQWTLNPKNSRLPDDHRMFDRTKNGHPFSAERATGEMIRLLQAEGNNPSPKEREKILRAARKYAAKTRPDKER